MDTITGDPSRAHLIQWLRDNYEQTGGPTLRSAVYAQYVEEYCTKLGYCKTPLHSAVFGKLLREAFPTLEIARLGARKTSKYEFLPGVRYHLTASLTQIFDTSRDRYFYVNFQRKDPAAPRSNTVANDPPSKTPQGNHTRKRDSPSSAPAASSVYSLLTSDSESDTQSAPDDSPEDMSPNYEAVPANKRPRLSHSEGQSPLASGGGLLVGLQAVTLQPQPVGNFLDSKQTPKQLTRPPAHNSPLLLLDASATELPGTRSAENQSGSDDPPGPTNHEGPFSFGKITLPPFELSFHAQSPQATAAAVYRQCIQRGADALLQLDIEGCIQIATYFWNTIRPQYAAVMGDERYLQEQYAFTLRALELLEAAFVPDPIQNPPPVWVLRKVRDFCLSMDDVVFRSLTWCPLELMQEYLRLIRRLFVEPVVTRTGLALLTWRVKEILTDQQLMTRVCQLWAALSPAALRTALAADAQFTALFSVVRSWLEGCSRSPAELAAQVNATLSSAQSAALSKANWDIVTQAITTEILLCANPSNTYAAIALQALLTFISSYIVFRSLQQLVGGNTPAQFVPNGTWWTPQPRR